jgi:hypothetical protein
MALGGSSLGEAVLDLRADDSQMDGDLNSARGRVQNALGGLGNLAGKLVTVGFVAAAAGLFGLVGGLGTSVNAAIDVQKIQAQTDAVLASTKHIAGVTQQLVSDTADGLSKLTGVDDDAVQSAENLLLTFTGIGKNVFPDTTKAVVDLATAMNGGAIPSAEQLQKTAIGVGKALNDFNGFNALKRQGVSFSDTQLKLIKHFKDTNNLVGYQKLVLAELQKEFGKAGEAAGDTFAGKLGRLQTILGNVQESIGGAILPVLTLLIGKLNDWLSSPLIQQGIDRFTQWLAAVLPPLLTMVFQYVDQGVSILKSLFNIALLLATGDFNGGIFGMQEDDPWISALLDGRDAVIGILGWLGKLKDAAVSGDWGAFATTLLSGLQTALGQLGTWGGKFWDWITDTALPALGGKLNALVTGITDWIAQHGPATWAQLVQWATDFWTWLMGPAGAITLAEANLFLLGNSISGGLQRAWLQQIKPALTVWGTEFWDWLSASGGITDQVSQKMVDLTDAFDKWANSSDTKNTIKRVGATIGGLINNAVGDFFASAEGQASTDNALKRFVLALTTSIANIKEGLVAIGKNIGVTLLDGIVELLTGKEASASIQEAFGRFFQLYLGGHPNLFAPLVPPAPTIPSMTIPGNGGGDASHLASFTQGGGVLVKILLGEKELTDFTQTVTFGAVKDLFGDAVQQVQTS